MVSVIFGSTDFRVSLVCSTVGMAVSVWDFNTSRSGSGVLCYGRFSGDISFFVVRWLTTCTTYNIIPRFFVFLMPFCRQTRFYRGGGGVPACKSSSLLLCKPPATETYTLASTYTCR